MTKEEVLKAFEQLSSEDQEAVRTEITDRAATVGCCGGEEMQEHMGSMMKMMQSSENPMEHCKEMMAMCQKMATSEVTSSEA